MIMLKNLHFTLVFAIASIVSLYGQPADRDIVTQAAEWVGITSNIKVHPKLNLAMEGQFRYVGALEGMQFQVRTGADYSINKHLSILAGYVYVWNPLYGKQPATYVNNEHRIFEQVAYKHKTGRFNFHHRARFEERFLQVHSNQNGEIVDQGYTNKLSRFRYRFMLNIPINNPAMDPKTWFVSIYDEFFLSWGKPVTFHKIDQNRIFVGMGYQFTKLVNVQAGAFYQELIKANGAKQENNIGIQVMATYNFDLTKHE